MHWKATDRCKGVHECTMASATGVMPRWSSGDRALNRSNRWAGVLAESTIWSGKSHSRSVMAVTCARVTPVPVQVRLMHRKDGAVAGLPVDAYRVAGRLARGCAHPSQRSEMVDLERALIVRRGGSRHGILLNADLAVQRNDDAFRNRDNTLPPADNRENRSQSRAVG